MPTINKPLAAAGRSDPRPARCPAAANEPLIELPVEYLAALC